MRLSASAIALQANDLVMVRFLNGQRFRYAWESCQDGTSMMALLCSLVGVQEWPSTAALVLAGCACVQTTMSNIPKGDEAPQDLLSMTLHCAQGLVPPAALLIAVNKVNAGSYITNQAAHDTYVAIRCLADAMAMKIDGTNASFSAFAALVNEAVTTAGFSPEYRQACANIMRVNFQA